MLSHKVPLWHLFWSKVLCQLRVEFIINVVETHAHPVDLKGDFFKLLGLVDVVVHEPIDLELFAEMWHVPAIVVVHETGKVGDDG